MTKKEYILLILLGLENDWPLARWLKILLMNNDLDNQIVEGLFVIFKEQISLIKDEYLRNKLMKSMDKLDLLRRKEQMEKDQESIEIFDLEQEIALS